MTRQTLYAPVLMQGDIVKDKIKSARIKAGWTQQKLADEAGTTKQTVSNIETGRFSPTMTTIKKIGKALDMDWRDLV